MNDAPPAPGPCATAAERGDDAQRYVDSLENPGKFWSTVTLGLDWFVPPTRVRDSFPDPDNPHTAWFADGELNASTNCLDRHLTARSDSPALLCDEGGDARDARALTWRDLHDEVCALANALRNLGVRKRDRVALYLPPIPEAVIAMLACARVGAIHAVIPCATSAEYLASCLAAARCKLVFTTDAATPSGSAMPLKQSVDAALARHATNSVETVIMVRRAGGAVNVQSPRDRWWSDIVEGQPLTCAPERMRAEDPLFIVFAPGADGAPEDMVYATGGYMTWAAYLHALQFGVHAGDVCWCTADLSSIAGHTYGVYGALANGATSLLRPGATATSAGTIPIARVCAQHGVTVLIAVAGAVNAWNDVHARSLTGGCGSLRILAVDGAVAAATRRHLFATIGRSTCTLVDCWGTAALGPGVFWTPSGTAQTAYKDCAMRPFFGVDPAIMDSAGRPIAGAGSGRLVIAGAWPGMPRALQKPHGNAADDHAVHGGYTPGVLASRSVDGSWRITGPAV